MRTADTYTISLNDMHFYVQIGVGEEERTVGEPITVSAHLVVKSDCQAFIEDDFTKLPDYSQIYDIIKQTVKCPTRLLECLAYRIGTAILDSANVVQAEITVTKPNPPVSSDGLKTSVTITVLS